MRADLAELLGNLSDAKVLVLGDIILDEYIWVKVERISPEAPMPVANVITKTYVPGGAANVANNVRTLGGTVILVGVLGDDNHSNKLREILIDKGINTNHLLIDKNKPTCVKSRVIAHGHQMLRIDQEETEGLDEDLEDNVIDMVDKAIATVDAIVIVDYNKGTVTQKVCERVISMAKATDMIVAVDPKGNDYTKYRGAFVLTPNQKEVEQVTRRHVDNMETAVDIGLSLIKETHIDNLLITRGEQGMLLVGKDGSYFNIPTVANEVYDVTGAGDTVIATLTSCLAVGADIDDAARLANLAAGVVVKKLGTATATPGEIERQMKSSIRKTANSKVVSRRELLSIIADLRSDNRTIVFTNGCFDLLHVGHIEYLKKAKQYGDVLIVGLNSDTSVKAIKGGFRPIMNEMDRAQIVAALEPVDYVVIFPETTPTEMIVELKPDVHVKGGDYKIEDLPESQAVHAYGGKVEIVDYVSDRSTTSIIDYIMKYRDDC